MSRWIVVLALASCSKKPDESSSKAAEVAKPKFVIKPIDKPHQPTLAELGPPVDVKTGFEALCAAVPDDGAKRSGDQILAYVRGATFQYPNPEVIRFWDGLGEMSDYDRLAAFKRRLDDNGVASCRLYDYMSRRKR
jgi:hypothetical protein